MYVKNTHFARDTKPLYGHENQKPPRILGRIHTLSRTPEFKRRLKKIRIREWYPAEHTRKTQHLEMDRVWLASANLFFCLFLLAEKSCELVSRWCRDLVTQCLCWMLPYVLQYQHLINSTHIRRRAENRVQRYLINWATNTQKYHSSKSEYGKCKKPFTHAMQ